MQDNNIGGDPNKNQVSLGGSQPGNLNLGGGDNANSSKPDVGRRGPIYSSGDVPADIPPSPLSKNGLGMSNKPESSKIEAPEKEEKTVPLGYTPDTQTPPLSNPITAGVHAESPSGDNLSKTKVNSENVGTPDMIGTSTSTEHPISGRRGGKKILKILVVLFLALLVVLAAFLIPKLFKKVPKGKESEVVWWGLWEEGKYIKPLIDEYQAKNPKVKIKYVKQSKEDYRERLMNAMAKGTAPDIFRFHNSWVPMLSKELDNVPASVMGASDYAQTFFPVITSDLTSGSGLVGLPLGYDALTLYINEDIFREENLDPPKTWVELEKDAKLLTKVENGVITQAGVALGRTENVDHWPEIIGLMLVQNGVDMNKIQGKLAEDALTFYTLFSRVDHVWDETLPPSTEAFASGKLAMYFAPSWRAFNIKEINPDLNFRTVPLPQVPKENHNEPDVSYATYWAEGVWARSKNKEAAWDFLKFISSKESLEKLYKNESVVRGFGEVYPRQDMTNLLLEHPVLGSIVSLASEARSWYLADRTFDGPTGINSQINKYFEDAINSLNEAKRAEDVVPTLSQGVSQVLSQYGLVRK